MPIRPPIYGLLAEFDNPTDLIRAASRTREEGYRKLDAYTPFPIEGLAEALGFRRTRLPLVVLIGGIVGCVGGYFLQYYCAAVAYPINIGGRPLNSWPAFIPVTFEMTVLVAALAAVLAMLGMNGLPMPYHPLFNVARFALATRSQFFLCVEATDPHFDLERTKRYLATLNPRAVTEVPH